MNDALAAATSRSQGSIYATNRIINPKKPEDLNVPDLSPVRRMTAGTPGNSRDRGKLFDSRYRLAANLRAEVEGCASARTVTPQDRLVKSACSTAFYFRSISGDKTNTQASLSASKSRSACRDRLRRSAMALVPALPTTSHTTFGGVP